MRLSWPWRPAASAQMVQMLPSLHLSAADAGSFEFCSLHLLSLRASPTRAHTTKVRGRSARGRRSAERLRSCCVFGVGKEGSREARPRRRASATGCVSRLIVSDQGGSGVRACECDGRPSPKTLESVGRPARSCWSHLPYACERNACKVLCDNSPPSLLRRALGCGFRAGDIGRRA